MSASGSEIPKAIQAAHAWLVAHGKPLEAALADALVGVREPRHGEAALAARQGPNGAVAWLDTDAPLDGSLRALHWLRTLGRADGAVAEGVATYVVAAQNADGGIGEGAEGLLTTARALAALSCTTRVRASVLTRAGAFLADAWSPDALAAGGPEAVCAWFPALCHAPGELTEFADAALQWCGREFEKGFRTGRVSPLAAASVFADCDAHALPGSRLAAKEVADALLQTALPDGSFPDSFPEGRGPVGPVGPGATCEALRGLHLLAAATGARSC